MTTEQIKKAVFEQTQLRSAPVVAAELGVTADQLTGWLLAGQGISMKVIEKAAAQYCDVASLASRPNEVVMGKPEAQEPPEDSMSVIPGANGFSAVQAGPTPREATATMAPPLAPPVQNRGAIATKADPIAVVKEPPVQKASKPAKNPAKNLCLLFPIYKSVVPATFMTVLAFWDRNTMYAEMFAGDAMIARSRNRLAKKFLEGSAEWCLWLDDDLVFPCGSPGLYRYLVGAVDPVQKKLQQGHWANGIDDKFLNYSTPSRLMSHGKTIVAGSYWDRFGRNTITAVYSQGPQNRFPSDSLHPVDFAGTGCMLIHRSVYESIANKYPGIHPENGECQYFTPIQGEIRMMGEDQSFCHRAKESGHSTYIDMGLILGHVGEVCFGLPK